MNTAQRRLLLATVAPGTVLLLFAVATKQFAGPLSGQWSLIALIGWIGVFGGGIGTEVIALRQR
jgi:hypothetical protein